MAVDIVRGTSLKPVASEQLARVISNQNQLSGQLFFGYPIIGGPDGPHTVDALLISPQKGIIVFDLIEGPDVGDYAARQDDSANGLEARLRPHRELMSRRNFRIEIHTISFAPGIPHTEPQRENDYPLANVSSLMSELAVFNWNEPDEMVYRRTLSAIQSITTIRSSAAQRVVKKATSRGGKLKALEASISTLDNKQGRAVIETVEGVQRIRGLAGSGKTIVLALKAAYLHALHRDWRIAVTFNTRSLKGHFRRLIERFSNEYGHGEPDWNSLSIVAAWGAPGGGEREGIYHEFCRLHDVPYFDFVSARREFGRGREFSKACDQALERVGEPRQYYDVIIVDEAQDLSPAFLRLCYGCLREPKRLVYAYDELQMLAGESLPSPDSIFGRGSDGTPKVQLGKRSRDSGVDDIILQVCYRNSRPVLVTAHALGFGIYRNGRPDETGIVQMFDHPQLWHEIGYAVQGGELKEGASVTLSRTQNTSPPFLADHSGIDDLIQFRCFESKEEQAEWLSTAIKTNLEDDELRHEDIMVINPNPVTTREEVGPIRRRLLELDVDSHTAGVDTDHVNADTFYQSPSFRQ